MSSEKLKNVCWRCNAVKDPTWAFCPFCASRLIDIRTPSLPNPAIDAHFLYDLYSFGWYNHQVGTIVLYDAAAGINRFYNPHIPENNQLIVEDGRAQQILRAKIFAEHMALLEAFGTLCIAIKKRKTQSFMWTFLNTEPQDVTQFYDSVLNTPVTSLQRLLKLPSLSLVQKAIDTGTNLPFAWLPDPNEPLTLEHIEYDYTTHCVNFVHIAKIYREPLKGEENKHKYNNVTIYNKIKHIFSLVEGNNWLNRPIDKLTAGIVLDDEGAIASLPMKQEDLEKEMSNTFLTTITGAELMALCIGLCRLGLLF